MDRTGSSILISLIWMSTNVPAVEPYSKRMKLMLCIIAIVYADAFANERDKLFPVMARFTKPHRYERFFRNACAIMDFDAREELSRTGCPTLIIAGDDDNTVGNDAPYELNDCIPDSKVYIYHGLGHGLFEEAKDFYDRVYEFCVSGKNF